MVEWYARNTWTRVPRPVTRLAALDPNRVEGLAVHWPGSAGRWGDAPTLAQSAARLEAERVQHTSPSSSDPSKPWSDIAYSFAVDQAGRVFDCRGVAYRPASNGSQDTNSRFLSCTVLMGMDDRPTPEALDGLRWLRREVVLRRYPKATRVVGHRDLYSTACPGDRLYAHVRSGALLAAPTAAPTPSPAPPTQPVTRPILAAPGAKMPRTISDDDVTAIRNSLLEIHWGNGADGKPFTLGLLLAEVLGNTRQTLALLAQLAHDDTVQLTPAQVDQIAAAVRAGGSDARAVLNTFLDAFAQAAAAARTA